MAQRAREEDENEVEWKGPASEVGTLDDATSSSSKLTQVRPAEKNVASCQGRARVGKLSVFRTSGWINQSQETRDASGL